MNRLREGIGRFAKKTSGSGMSPKKAGIFLGIAFVLYWLMYQPVESADLLRQALGGVGDAAGRLAEFIRQLVG